MQEQNSKNKIKLAFKAHSVIDVITNSSTELFISNEGLTVEIVKEMLHDCIERYNQDVDDGKYKTKWSDGHRVSIDDFDEPYIYTQEKLNEHKRQAEEYKKRWPDSSWTWDGWGYEHEGTVGAVMIESSSDNTIPYDMWEMLEDEFNAERYHLG